MPRRNTVKQFVEDSFYHIYNIGLDKRTIFCDDHDYKTFLYILKRYLKRVEPLEGFNPKKIPPQETLWREIQLVAYCLMPNHFHLLVKQFTKDAITKLMRRISTNFVMYFNERYERSGPLFQSIYKAVLIDSDPYLLHITRYVHTNSKDLGPESLNLEQNWTSFKNYPYSSYLDYLGQRQTDWIHPEEILKLFQTGKLLGTSRESSCQTFVESYHIDSKILLGKLILE